MRAVANYALSATKSSPDGARGAFDESVEQIERWIRSKGDSEQIGNARYEITYTDGRTAELQAETIEAGDGGLRAFILTEPIPDSVFRTRLEVGWQDRVAEVNCELSVGGESPGVGPIRFDAWGPTVLREVIDQGGWTFGSDELCSTPLAFDGPTGGQELIDMIWSEGRLLPLITVSDYEGLPLHPRIDEQIARDVSGLAVVARIDSDAAWTLTTQRGQAWSCFHGAIRLYWPGSKSAEAPREHPLWTQARLLTGVPDTWEAAKRIRNELRRRVLGQSAFSVRESTVCSAVREAKLESERQEREVERGLARDAQDWEGLANSYASENEALKTENRDLKERNRDLEIQLHNTNEALRHSRAPDVAPDEVAPDEDSPPTTVLEAVDAARDRFGDVLTFGSDVAKGASELRDEAGPPDKVLRYLEQLAEMTRLRRAGDLGTDPIRWLRARNVDASEESETIRNSRDEMARRRWDAGTTQREFSKHLKPNEATHPDRCVRIYFDYDDDREKTIVGWVGRHP